MVQRWAMITARAASCWLVVTCAIAGCGGASSGGNGVLSLPADTSGQGLPGFDGFAFDNQAADLAPDALLDVAGDLPDDATGTAPDDARVDAADDVTSADGVSLACEQTCAIDDDCNAVADPCTASLCQLGCCQAAPTVGVPCDDGIPCNGPDACKNGACTPAVPSGCDDGLACTTDACDGEKCHHTVQDGWCHIGTTCLEASASIPGDPCKICDPVQDQDSWSVLAGCCKKDSDCPVIGSCDQPSCDTIQGKCVILKISGCCKSDLDCDDGNLCTTDSCDLGSGNCSSANVACPSPSQCQIATCDPTDGQCKPDVLPGWCLIDSQCFGGGNPNPSNACQICISTNKATDWSSTPGTACDDKNPCTFSDICTSAGICKGTSQPGCCQSDADCSNNGIACKVGQCNTAVGLCTLSDDPTCCTAGVCCVVADQVIAPAGTSCGSTVIGSDYQCSGADIQQHDFTPGCNGTSPTVCTNALSSASAGPWSTINTCPANTLCTPQGSGIVPSCVVQGSCANACGGTGSQGCACSADCVAGGTCCTDATSVCGCTSGACCDTGAGIVLATGTPCGAPAAVVQWQCAGNALQQRTGQGKCIGSTTCSTTASDVFWGGWQTTQTCPGTCTAAADGSSGSCQALTGSCYASCGVQSSSGNCSCKANCKAAGTCCTDYDYYGCDYGQVCGIQSNTCAGACGTQSGSSSCYCDDFCNTAGDCCPDKFLCGCSP